MSQEKEKNSNGCLMAGGIGCLVIVLLGVAAGIFIYTKGASLAKSGMAMVAEKAADQIMQDMNYPKDQRQAIMKPLKRFTTALKNDEVDLEEAAKVLESAAKEIENGGFMASMLYTGFNHAYLQKSGLTEEEKTEGQKQLSRYAQGLLEKSIDKDNQSEIEKIVFKTREGAQGQEHKQLKDALSDPEVKSCLEEMKKQADQAGIPDQTYTFDPAKELEEVVNHALEKMKSP